MKCVIIRGFYVWAGNKEFEKLQMKPYSTSCRDQSKIQPETHKPTSACFGLCCSSVKRTGKKSSVWVDFWVCGSFFSLKYARNAQVFVLHDVQRQHCAACASTFTLCMDSQRLFCRGARLPRPRNQKPVYFTLEFSSLHGVNFETSNVPRNAMIKIWF